MPEIRLMPSDPEYAHFNELAQKIAVATNPQAHFWGEGQEMPEPERHAIISVLKEAMGALMRSHLSFSEVFSGLFK